MPLRNRIEAQGAGPSRQGAVSREFGPHERAGERGVEALAREDDVARDRTGRHHDACIAHVIQAKQAVAPDVRVGGGGIGLPALEGAERAAVGEVELLAPEVRVRLVAERAQLEVRHDVPRRAARRDPGDALAAQLVEARSAAAAVASDDERGVVERARVADDDRHGFSYVGEAELVCDQGRRPDGVAEAEIAGLEEAGVAREEHRLERGAVRPQDGRSEIDEGLGGTEAVGDDTESNRGGLHARNLARAVCSGAPVR